MSQAAPDSGSSVDRRSRVRYPPFVPTVLRNLLLSVVAVALGLSSSGFLSLCVHDDQNINIGIHLPRFQSVNQWTLKFQVYSNVLLKFFC